MCGGGGGSVDLAGVSIHLECLSRDECRIPPQNKISMGQEGGGGIPKGSQYSNTF